MKSRIFFCFRMVAAVLVVLLILQSLPLSISIPTNAATNEQPEETALIEKDDSVPDNAAVSDSVYGAKEPVSTPRKKESENFFVGGRVLSGDKGISGAEVSLIGKYNYNAVTNENGSFIITGDIDGPYEIIVKHEKYKTYKKTYEGNDDLTAFNEIRMEPKSEQTDFRFAIEEPGSITYGTDFKNAAIGGKGTGKITYKVVEREDVEGADVASVDDTGKLSINKAGKITVEATIESDDEYLSKTVSYDLTINKAELTRFIFDEGVILYGRQPKYLIMKNNMEIIQNNITYTIESDENGIIKSIDKDTGKLTYNEEIEKGDNDYLGEVVIKVTREGDERYNPKSDLCTLTIMNDEKEYFKINGEKNSNGWYQNATLEAKEKFMLCIIGENGEISQDNIDWKDILEVNRDVDSDRPLFVGQRTMDEDFSSIEQIKSSAIEVKDLKLDVKKPVIGVNFAKPHTYKVDNTEFYEKNFTATITVTDEISGIERVWCSVAPESRDINKITLVSIDKEDNDKKAIATFRSGSEFNGKITFYATDKAGNSSYVEYVDTIIVDNTPPEITVQYNQNNQNNYYNLPRKATIKIKEANFDKNKVEIFVNKDSKGYYIDTKKLKFETTGEEKDIHVAEITFEEDGKYTFDISFTDNCGNSCEPYKSDEFIIDKTRPVILVSYDNNTVQNSVYYNKERTATITIKERNFDIEGLTAEITIRDADNNIIDTKKNEDLQWVRNGDDVKTEIKTSEDGYYTLNISCTDMAQNSDDFTDDYVIDKVAPQRLKVEYNEPSFQDIMLEVLSFGFYNASVSVTISAEDITSGIDHFKYSYAVESGASSKNKGESNVIIHVNNIKGENGIKIAKHTFKIDPQFRGTVSFEAVDKAGNVSKFDEKKVIVVDNAAPLVTVRYDNQNAINGSFYNGSRKATIEIDEANFYDEDVIITLGRKYSEAEYKETRVKPQFIKNEDIYTAEIDFIEDGDYTFDISYTDRSCNAFDSYEMDKFSIDKTKPVIEISFDNNAALNNNYYNAKREAVIKVTEHYFNPERIEASFAVINSENNNAAAEDYVSYLKNPKNWTTEGDVHTASIVFAEDAKYSFNISYTDYADNKSDDLGTYEFVIDKTNPENLSISYETPVLSTIIDDSPFYFYNAPVKVTMTADDALAGIDHIIYSYKVEEGSSPENRGLTDQKVTSENIVYNGKTASFSFLIQPQYRGKLDFKVVDRAGNMSVLEDDKVIVVDNVAPKISVQYDNQSSRNSTFYNADRTATIVIEEANFFSSDVRIVVEKRLNSQSSFAETIVNPVFTKNGDTYTASILFNENADYTFDISYTDKSGNVFDSYKKDEFTIDKMKPEIKVAYDNNSAVNKKMFKDKRTATITIIEHNFREEDVSVTITARDKDGDNVVNLAPQLKDAASWNHNGDTHTAEVTFKEDANYTFDIACMDMAGNINSSVDYSSSVAPNEFTVDRTMPTGSIQIGDWRTSKNGTVWNTFIDVITMGLWTNKEVFVTISADDALSGVDYIKYLRTDTPLTLEDVKSKSEGWSASREDKVTFKIQPDEQLIVYAGITDKAGNTAFISSDGVIVDNTSPEVGVLSPVISAAVRETAKNMIFNKDVTVDIAVEDPISKNSVYSGLKSVKYQVVNMGNVTQEGELYTFTELHPAKSDLKQKWTGSIVVESIKNNSNDVKVIITAEDNAENKATKTLPIKIDITPPSIKVSYDNNSQDSDFNGFFKDKRTARVVITERNFNKEEIKLNITNTHGKSPQIGDWIKEPGTGNEDDTTYTAIITFSEDGDYTFDISYTDLANNRNVEVDYGNSAAPNSFTIDRTLPAIAVNYSTDKASNGNYFNDKRVATIYITEHNFDPGRVIISMTSTDGGKPVSTPPVSQWLSNGDIHSATINFDKDALYTLDIDVTDKAGNKAEKFKQDSFYIDTIVPSISITGVADKSANNGDVMPVVECSDTNIDFNNVTVNLYGANRKTVNFDGTVEYSNNSVVIRFKNFEKIKEVDDLYTLSVNAMDKAGNSSYQSITFSVNRFGSNYTVAKTTERILNRFIPNEEDIVLIETNVDVLQDVRITLFKDNITKVLIKDKDYVIEEISGENMWHQYKYTINKNNFKDDGVYRITVYSVDKANNRSENNMDSKLTEISFGVDKTPPNVIVADLEDGKTYPVDIKPVSMSINDNLSLELIQVELDGEDYKKWLRQDIEKNAPRYSDFTFDISGDSTQAHTVKVIAVDAAGNKKTVLVKNFYVTTNLMIRFVNNKLVFFGTTSGMTTIMITLTGYAIVRRRKNKAI